jgi:hypothetical protein
MVFARKKSVAHCGFIQSLLTRQKPHDMLVQQKHPAPLTFDNGCQPLLLQAWFRLFEVTLCNRD